MAEPEDLLADTLESLYDYSPISQGSAGTEFTYPCPEPLRDRWLANLEPEDARAAASLDIVLTTPDTQPANWSLHASAIWVSALYLAAHLPELPLERTAPAPPLRVLELGAGAALPSVLIARCYPSARVVASDYPDAALLRTLAANVRRNGARCAIAPYAWGTSPAPLFATAGAGTDGFDLVVAADTLWNPELHAPFVEALRLTVGRRGEARAHLVAGLHTGAYTVEAFLARVRAGGFVVEDAQMREARGERRRPWALEVAETYDEQERRRWVVWVVLRWKDEETRL